MRIAILGAGATGVCAALELSQRGHEVDLYEANAEPVGAASARNEGKIHLGLIYAKDPTLRTAATLIGGALRFASCLRRWIEFTPDSVTVSTPFWYGVHRGSMVDADRLRDHYARCQALFADIQANVGEKYLGLDRKLCIREVHDRDLGGQVDGSYFDALFETSERSVDAGDVARLLTAALHDSPRVSFLGGTRVCRVSRHPRGGFTVTSSCEGLIRQEPYDQVANTLWHGRLEIDRTMGLVPPRPWIHRYKLANRIPVALRPTDLPSLTCVLGPFGDLVNFGDRGLFLSWYPTGMLAASLELRPPDWESLIEPAARRSAFERSFEEWTRRCPRLAALRFDPAEVDLSGGIIFAWGATDIDQPESRLHSRYEIGVHSVDGYHTVNTGKYTMAPYLGLRTANRIMGIS